MAEPAAQPKDFDSLMAQALSEIDQEKAGPGEAAMAEAKVDPTGTFMVDPNKPARFATLDDMPNGWQEPELPASVFFDAPVGGIVAAALETKDFVVGEPAYDHKSAARRQFEEIEAKRKARSSAYALSGGLSQFAAGMIGLGKVAKAGKAIKGIGSLLTAAEAATTATRAGRAALTVGKPALAGGVVFDPHEARLSNLVQSVPYLQNPINAYLAADPSDSAAEGRFKSALESVGLDAAVGATIYGAVKAFRYFKAGDTRAAAKAAEELDGSLKGPDVEAVAPPDHSTQPMDVAAPEAKSPEGVPTLLNDNVPGRPLTAANENGGAPEIATASPPTGRAAPTSEAPPAANTNTPPAGTEAAGETAAATNPTNEGVPTPTASLTDAGGAAQSERFKTVEVTPGQTEAILTRVKDDAEALVKYGSREEAIKQGYKFGREDAIPWQKLNAPDDIKALVGNVAGSLRGELDKLKGGAVLKDKRVEALANQRLELYGESPEEVLGLFQQAGEGAADLAATMEAADAVALKMMDEVFGLARRINMGDFSAWGGDRAAAMAEFGKRVSLAATVEGHARSMLSNAARTVRRGRGDLGRMSFENIQELRSMDPDMLLKIIEGTNGNTKALKEALSKPSLISRAVDFASFLNVNNLLWGWKTHVVNLAGNVAMIQLRSAEKAVGATLMGNSALATKAVREYRYQAAALHDSFKLASKAFLDGDSVLNPHEVEIHRNSSSVNTKTAFKPIQNTGDILDNGLKASFTALGLPTRALGAVDEMVKQVRYRSYVMADASVRADELGLVGQDRAVYIDQALTSSFDSTGRGTNQAALRDAQISTFSVDLNPGTIGAGVQNMVRTVPALRLILPFVKTPTNVLRYAQKLTPGLNILQTEFRHALTGKRGAEEQAHAVGQMAMGTLFVGTAAVMVENGIFTGSGPKDPAARRELLAQGWQPNSVVITDPETGEKTYYPLGRLDPFGLPFGIVADIMDVMQHEDKTEAASPAMVAVLMAVTNQIKDRTYLMSLNSFLDAVTDPGRYGEKSAGRMAANLIPFASMLRQSNPDPYMREARSITDNLMATVPGLSEKLPPRRDGFGDQIIVRRNLITSDENLLVEREVQRIGLEVGAAAIAAPSPRQKGVDLRDITLKDGKNAYDVFQDYAGHPKGAPSLKEAFGRLIASEAYQNAPDGEPGTDGTKQWMLRGITAKYRSAAAKRLLAESEEFRKAAYEAELKVRGAYAESRDNGRKSSTEGLMQTYGVPIAPTR